MRFFRNKEEIHLKLKVFKTQLDCKADGIYDGQRKYKFNPNLQLLLGRIYICD